MNEISDQEIKDRIKNLSSLTKEDLEKLTEVERTSNLIFLMSYLRNNLTEKEYSRKPDKPDILLESVRLITMTPEQKEQQRQSFVYGNTKMGNEQITRELVSEIANNLKNNEQKFNL